MTNKDFSKIQKTLEVVERPDTSFRSSDESYRALIAALDLGWQVEQPVYLRPRWDEGREKVYHFILTKDSTDKPYLITTRYNQKVERLVFEEGWQVN
jgi:hypothetical protein